MTQPRIGVNVGDLRRPPKEALRRAAALAFRMVEIPAVSGDIAPRTLSSSGRRHLAHYVEGLGLRLVALVADLPGLRFTDPQTAEQRIARTQEVLDLAADLKVPTVTASVASLTHPESGEPSATALEALRRLGEFADLRGVNLALRFASDSGDRMSRVLAALNCSSIRICLDPAALVLHGIPPLRSIESWIDQVDLFYARDARAGSAERAGVETRLGEGDVDLVGVLDVLHEAEYRGPYVIRRQDTAHAENDWQHARDYLTASLRSA